MWMEAEFVFTIKLYYSGLSSRWYIFILIRGISRYVSQNWNPKKTQYIYSAYQAIVRSFMKLKNTLGKVVIEIQAQNITYVICSFKYVRFQSQQLLVPSQQITHNSNSRYLFLRRSIIWNPWIIILRIKSLLSQGIVWFLYIKYSFMYLLMMVW